MHLAARSADTGDLLDDVTGEIGAARLPVQDGDPTKKENKEAIENAEFLVRERKSKRGDRFPLSVTFYDAATPKLWG
ncbi:hypothetical protein ACVWZZ_003463 [Bradyrhizobium sp. LM6.10]